MPGVTTSAIEVTNISKHGLWLLTADGEHFLAFSGTHGSGMPLSAHILNVEEPSPGHYHWPDLDVDLSLQIIRDPDRFPLKAKV